MIEVLIFFRLGLAQGFDGLVVAPPCGVEQSLIVSLCFLSGRVWSSWIAFR